MALTFYFLYFLVVLALFAMKRYVYMYIGVSIYVCTCIYTHRDVHSSVIHNNQKVITTQMSIN